MASRGKLTAKDCNFVHVDDSWKTYVWKEEVASKRWQDNWGFLCEEYHKLRADINASRGLPSSPSHSPSPHEGSLHLPPLPAAPSPPSLPITTSREVGWLSCDPQHKLEVFERWGRPKGSILKHLNWPHDSIE